MKRLSKTLKIIGSLKKLDFLNLEFIEKTSNNTWVENCFFICKFKNHKHTLHSENIHLNGVTDLIVNLGIHLEQEVKRNNHNFNRLYSLTDRRTELLSKLIENLYYIKAQNTTKSSVYYKRRRLR